MLKAEFLLHHQISRPNWDQFVESSTEGCLYARSWFLDAVMPEWGAVVVQQSGQWEAVLPLRIREKYGIGYALQPTFCQYLGVLFKQLSGRNNHVLHKKRTLLQAIISAIPEKIRLFSYNFSPEFDYFLPFVHEGFDVKPRMSLVLPLDRPLPSIVGDFSTSVLNHIKKSQQNGLVCRMGTGIDVLLQRMLRYRFIRRPEECEALERLGRFALERNLGFLLEVVDTQENIQCSGLFLIEKEKAVFVASALDRDKRQFGSNSLLILEAIKKCKLMGIKELDFKGSMLYGVEKFFLGFNPRQILYLNITRNKLGVLENMAYQMLKKPGSNGSWRLFNLP